MFREYSITTPQIQTNHISATLLLPRSSQYTISTAHVPSVHHHSIPANIQAVHYISFPCQSVHYLSYTCPIVHCLQSCPLRIPPLQPLLQVRITPLLPMSSQYIIFPAFVQPVHHLFCFYPVRIPPLCPYPVRIPSL